MTQTKPKRQRKIEELKQQIADNQHPQQSADRQSRIEDALKTAEKIIAQLEVEVEQDSRG